MAAEVIGCEVAAINEAIIGNSNEEAAAATENEANKSQQQFLERLYAFLEQEPPLNPLLASYFAKAFNVLVSRKAAQNLYSHQLACLQVLEFLKKKNLVEDILRHMTTSAVSDFLLGLITCVDGADIKKDLLDWLDEAQLVQSIVKLLKPTSNRDRHDNASRLLIEMLRVSRDAQHLPPGERCEDAILATIEHPDTVKLLLEVIFEDEEESGSKNESSLVNGIAILLAILEWRGPSHYMQQQQEMAAAMFGGGLNTADEAAVSPEEEAKQQKLFEATIESILPRIQDFADLLLKPPPKPAIKTTAGLLDPPLGATRLSKCINTTVIYNELLNNTQFSDVAKLVNSLLATQNIEVNKKLAETKTLDILLVRHQNAS